MRTRMYTNNRQYQHAYIYEGERVSGVFASNVDFADDDVASATRIHNNSNSTSSSGDTETGAAAALACLPPIPQHINMFATVDDAVRAVSVFYKELRRQDGRQKKKLIVLVSSRVVFIKLIKAFDIHFYRNKIMAKKGANSGICVRWLLLLLLLLRLLSVCE